MHVQTADLANLLHLQQIDMDAARAQKQLDELPQRKTILEIRTKKNAIEQKRTQLKTLRSEVNIKLTRIADEDAALADKQRRVQGEIDALNGDYRGVEARTKELNGFTKRRTALELDLLEVGEELAKVEAVQDQVERALSGLNEQEETATQQFILEGGSLKESLAKFSAQRTRYVGLLPQNIVDAYQKTAARVGGVGVALLHGSNCGACRMGIESGRLIGMKAEGNLVPCPHCSRLLVLE